MPHQQQSTTLNENVDSGVILVVPNVVSASPVNVSPPLVEEGPKTRPGSAIKKHIFFSFAAVFSIGLLLGSGIAAVILNLPDSKVDHTASDEKYTLDTDRDGIIDIDEMTVYGTDPNNANDMMVRTGLLLCSNSLSQIFPTYRSGEAVILSANEANNCEVIHAFYPTHNHSVAWGQFYLKASSDGSWQVAKENLTGFKTVNTEIDLPSSVSVVYDGMTLGYGIGSNVAWFSFDESPTFYNSVKISGVKIDPSLVMKLGVIPNLAKNINIIQTLVHLQIDELTVPFFFADQVTYTGQVDVRGDVIKTWRLNSNSVPLEGIDPAPLFPAGYSTILLKEDSVDMDYWVILAPDSYLGTDLDSVVSLKDVVPFEVKDMTWFKDLRSRLPTNGRLKGGIWTSDEVEAAEQYSSSTVSSIHDLIQSKNQVGVSVDCYVLWMKLGDVLSSFEENGGMDLSEVQAILKFLDLQGTALGLMLDTDINGEVTTRSFPSFVGLALTFDQVDIDSTLVMGQMNGVVHKIDTAKGSLPLLMIDYLDLYDSTVQTAIEDISSNPGSFESNSVNQRMVEVNGYLVGTTVKTLSDQIDDIPELSLLKVIQYLPYDIGVYQLFEVSESSNKVYGVPLIQVVKGKGSTYLGEEKKVRGWFRNDDVSTNIRSIIEENLKEKGIPLYLLDYLESFLTRNPQSLNLSSFIKDRFRTDLFISVDGFLKDLISELFSGLGDIPKPQDPFADLFTHDFENSKDSMDSMISGLNEMIQSSLENLMESMSFLDDSVSDIDSCQQQIQDMIDRDLSMDELSSYVSSLKQKITALNGTIPAMEKLCNDQYTFLMNVKNGINSILHNVKSVQNITNNLDKTLANILWDLFNTTIGAFDITKVMDDIKSKLPYFYDPLGLLTQFLIDIETIIKDGIKISIEAATNGCQSFLAFVHTTQFAFITTLINGVSGIMNSLSTWQQTVLQTATSFINSATSTIGTIRSRITEAFSSIASIKDAIDNGLKETVLDLLDEGLTIIKNLGSLHLGLLGLLTNVSGNKSWISEEFTSLLDNQASYFGTLLDIVMEKSNEVLESFNADLRGKISDMISLTFKDEDSNYLDEYFDGIIRDYAMNMSLFFDEGLLKILAKGQFIEVKGFIVAYSLHE